jgi:YidC/Oxa1 family membrane protein insertase
MTEFLFGWLYGPIGTMLSWFSSLFGGSYALALLLYALLFKLLFLPFSIKQQKNQIKMAKLAPQIELIKAKYRGRNDQPTMQKMQQEIMEFQQKEGYSPFSGCLPLLLQLPIIIFLYDIIRNPLSYICKVSENGITKIKEIISATATDEIGLVSEINKYVAANGDSAIKEYINIESIPDFTLFGIDFAAQPSLTAISWIVLIPFIAAGLTWLSMWLSRKWNGNGMAAMQTQDAQAKASMTMMDIMMPAMTLFIAFSFSGMLGLYWIYQSALGILQTFILSRVMPMPKYTAEELKAMRKAQKAAEKAQRQALKEQPKYRSLHYIDEDDYDSRPELKRPDGQKPQKKNNNISIDSPEIKD